jgi:hypothetical protein
VPLDIAPDTAAALKLAAVEAQLLYLEPMAAKPFNYTYDPGEGVAQSNAAYAPRRVKVHNARPIAERLSLDVEGFALARRRSSVEDFDDEALVSSLGHAEAARLVGDATGAERVVVFDHTIRRRISGTADRTPGAARQPAIRVHDDYTEASGPQRVRDVMGEDAEALLGRRFAFVNVWRPIRHPAIDWPLALCDVRSVPDADLVAMDLIYRDRRGEIYGATWSPGHRWFYFPAMQLDEAVLIKCYDSDPRVARFTLHTGFEDPTTPADAPPRESIEFRTIAFF